MAHGKLCYSGPVDVEAGLMHLIAHEDVDNGEFYFVKVSKTLPLGKLSTSLV